MMAGRHYSRSSLLKLVYVLLLFLACFFHSSAWADELEKIAIQLKWRHSFQFAGYYAAIQQGYYREEGLEVSLKEIDFSQDFVEQVLRGESQYGVSDSTLLIYHLKGRPVLLVDQYFQHSPLVFLTRRDSGIVSPYEMAGKTLAFNTTNQGDASLNALLLKTLGSLDKIREVPFSDNVYQDFIAGKIDVVSAYSTSQPFLMQERNIDINIINPQNYGIDFYGDNLFTTQQELTDHAGRIARVSRATRKGWRYALEHPDKIIDLIRQSYNPTHSTAYLQYEAANTRQMIIPELIPIGSIDPSRYQLAAEDYRRLGFADKDSVEESFFYSTNRSGQANKIALSPEEEAWINAHPVVIYGAERDWAPYDFMDQKGRHAGYSADLIRLIGKYSGLNFTPQFNDWSDLLAEARKGRIDLLPALYQTDDRNEFLAFTEPYQQILSYFFVHESISANNLEDLNGKTIAIPKDFAQIQQIKQRMPGLKIVETDSLMAAVHAVIERKADVLLESYPVMHYLLQQQNISSIQPFKPFATSDIRMLRMAVRKNQPQLLSIVQKALAAVPEYEHRRLAEQWFGFKEFSSPTLQLNDAELAWLNAHPVLRFVGDPNWLPYEGFDNQGRYIGIVSEYLRLLEQILGIDFQVIPTATWAQSLTKAQAGEVDIISETVNSNLAKQWVFTRSYLSSPVVIVMRDDEDYVDNIEQIKHRKLSLIENYGYNPALKAAYPDIAFSEVQTIQHGLAAVSTGKVDALLCTLAQASYHIANQGYNNVRIVGKTEFATEMGFGVRRELEPLVPLLNRALDAISQTEHQRINNIWGKERFAPKTDYWLLAKIVSAFLLILALVFFRNHKLLSEIKRRQESERQVRQLNQRLGLATSVASLGVWEIVFNSPPKVIFDNKMLEIYGLEPSSELNLQDWLQLIHKDDRAAVQQSIQKLRIRRGEDHIEFRIVRPDGEIRNIYSGARSTKMEKQAVTIIGVNFDITPRKSIELALQNAKLQAENANRAKSQFLANMSHEIRTPLNAIIGFTELLSEQVKDAKLKSFVNTIQSAGHTLLALINDILDLSKIEAGKLRIEKKVCNPHELFTELGQIFMMKMRERDLDFILDIDPKIPENLLLDATRLRQILFNLIGNAVKFTERGHVCLRARYGNEDRIRSRVDLYIDVEDSGIGISTDKQEAIFNDFEQVEGQDVRRYGGTGLGLGISKRLTEMMGGTISLKSEPNTGSTFTLHFKDVDISTINPEPQRIKTDVPVEFQPASILVVDDVEDNRSLLRECFSETPLRVFEVENGLQAVQRARQGDIDLILMDIRMPVMDGYQAAEKIKAFSDAPIIALTASVMQDDYERAKNSNFDGYLRKPVLKSDLFTELKRFLAHESQEAQTESAVGLSLNSSELNALPAALVALENLAANCSVISRNNNMAEIEKFANAVLNLGNTQNIRCIKDYASTLQTYIDSFDIVAIKQALNDYQSLIQQLSAENAKNTG